MKARRKLKPIVAGAVLAGGVALASGHTSLKSIAEEDRKLGP